MSAGALGSAWAEDAATAPKAAAATQTQAAASNEKLVPDKPTLATAFMGRSVYASTDPESETIGDVNDLIISDNGEITDAVVGVGGFLGIGEKNVAVPFDQLQIVERDGQIRLIYSATREQLDAAPAVDLTAYDPAARYSEQQAAMNAAETDAANPAMAPADDTAMAPATDQMATDQMTTANSTWGKDSFRTFSPDQVRASTMIGQTVYGPDDANIGEVSDLVLQEDGQTRSALIDVGGFLGMGEKTVAIPFSAIQVQQAKDTDKLHLNVAMTKDQLEAQSAYQRPDRMAASRAGERYGADG